MDQDPLFWGSRCPPGCRSSCLVISPADGLDYDERQWVGAVVVVEHGHLQLECRSGEQACFGEGAILWLTGLNLRRIINPGLTPLVLRSIRRAPGARPDP